MKLIDKIRTTITALVSLGYVPGTPGRQTIDVWTGEKVETLPITYEGGQFTVKRGEETFCFAIRVETMTT
jgi:hypothetical protein